MRVLSARLLVPAVLVVVAWGGAHLLTSRNLPVTPAAWPGGAAVPSPSAAGAALPRAGLAAPSPTAGAGAAVPILPDALGKLNADTRDTAIGLYTLIQQLEDAFRGHLEQLVQRLEPGR